MRDGEVVLVIRSRNLDQTQTYPDSRRAVRALRSLDAFYRRHGARVASEEGKRVARFPDGEEVHYWLERS